MATKNIVESILGPLTIGVLVRNYRRSHELTLEQLSKQLRTPKATLAGIESGKKKLGLKETLALAQKLDEPRMVYARVWFEQEARNAGLEFEDVIKLV